MSDLNYASQEVVLTDETTGYKCNPDVNGNLPVLAGQTGSWVTGITGNVNVVGITGLQVTETAILSGITGIKAQTDLLTYETGITGATGSAGLNVFPRCDLQQGFSPDPYYQPFDTNGDQRGPLNIITAGSLHTRGQVLTDEGSFRDDFGANLALGSTGTAVFTNGSNVVTGAGFRAEGLSKDWYIKASAHADTMYTKVARIESDTKLFLDVVYPGATTTSATYSKSMWTPTVVGAGSYNVNTSILNLVGTTATNTATQVFRESDYGPLTFYANAKISQRIANQQGVLGFSEGDNSGARAYISFTGTDNTVATLVTANSSNPSDVQQTTFKLPAGITSGAYINYRIEQRNHVVRAFTNEIIVATHETHIPGPYDTMFTVMAITNTGAAASATTLSVDTVYVANYNSIEVNITSKGQKPSTDSVSVTMAQDEGGINTINNILYAATWEATFGATTEQNFFILTNPAGSKENFVFTNCYLEQTSTAGAYSSTARFYANPTAVSNGAAGAIANRLIGSTVASSGTLLTGASGATITATRTNANKLLTISQGTAGTTAITPLGGELVLPPGNTLLVTMQLSNNAGIGALTLVWREIPILS
jgi:hypothetical protein